MFNFRTDMALERRDIYKKANELEDNISGVESEELKDGDKIRTTRVKITTASGEEAIGKPMGNYITIDVRSLKIAQETEIQEAANIVNRELKLLIESHIKSQDDILVVGLGNLAVTPDSLRSESYSRY